MAWLRSEHAQHASFLDNERLHQHDIVRFLLIPSFVRIAEELLHLDASCAGGAIAMLS